MRSKPSPDHDLPTKAENNQSRVVKLPLRDKGRMDEAAGDKAKHDCSGNVKGKRG
jgi:hypothetical protein